MELAFCVLSVPLERSLAPLLSTHDSIIKKITAGVNALQRNEGNADNVNNKVKVRGIGINRDENRKSKRCSTQNMIKLAAEA